jgi:hypothetical protein
MGCEFSDKIREFKRQLLGEQYSKLTPENQVRFYRMYGDIDKIKDDDTYTIYYHCKRVIRTQ